MTGSPAPGGAPHGAAADAAGRQAVIAARIRSAVKAALRWLPRTRTGDFLHALAFFVYAHRRLPRRGSGLFNDYLFFLMTGGELADALRQITSDKVYAKLFVEGIIGGKVTPETYAVFDSVDQIRRADLPERCVLKAAHGTDAIVFLEHANAEISPADYATLRRALAFDLYREYREINYKHLRKRILCEELVESRETIKDYKLFCFRGRVRLVFLCHPRHSLYKRREQNIYDREWNRLDITQNGYPDGDWEEMPERFAEMCSIAEQLAVHFELVRVDMYLTGGRIHVGELTHCHNQALGRFATIEQERQVSRILFG